MRAHRIALGVTLVTALIILGTDAARAAQPQLSINPDHILKGSTPTVTIILDKGLLPPGEKTIKVRVAGADITVTPSPEGKLDVPLPKLDITGRVGLAVIGKDDTPVAVGDLTYVEAAAASPIPGVASSVSMVFVYLALLLVLPLFATLYDIQKSYRERNVILQTLLKGANMEEVRNLLAGLDTGPTGFVGLTRGLIAITLLIILGVAVFHLVVFAPKVPDIAEKLLTLLAGGLTSITGFYFGARAATEGAQQAQARGTTASMSKPAPIITGVDPKKPTAGEPVKIAGQAFGKEAGTVWFGQVSATPPSPSDWSDTLINVSVPDGLQGTVKIHVTTKANVDSNDFEFDVTPPKPLPPPPSPPPPPPPPPAAPVAGIGPAPTITGVDPKEPKAGEPVKIAGQAFGKEKGTVRFGPVSVTPANWSDSLIEVSVPDNIHGTVKIHVTTKANVDSNDVDFDVTPAALPPPAGEEVETEVDE